MSTRLLETDDPEWDRLVAAGVDDPYFARSYVAAEAQATGRRGVLVEARAASWHVVHVLLLEEAAEAATIARTPGYGGPWLLTCGDPGVDVAKARRALDDALREIGVVHEVVVATPWLPYIDHVASQCGLSRAKSVCVLRLDHESRSRQSSGRRYDIRRGERSHHVTWRPLGHDGAAAFAARYAAAMEALEADDRWRFPAAYFHTLADARPGVVWEATAEASDGGASCLLLVAGSRASYLFSARWGEAVGSTSVALWRAQQEVKALGSREMLLGGGTTDLPDDPLLSYKRSWGAEIVPLYVGARVFDPERQRQLDAIGATRQLPASAVVA